MKLITKDVGYAVRAICFIAKKNKRIVSVSELAKCLKIPLPFLRKLLQVLSKKRILKSHKGKGGGFMLAIPINKIFLIDLIRIFQGPLELIECIFKKKTCPHIKTCKLKKRIDKIQKYLVSELKNITIVALLK